MIKNGETKVLELKKTLATGEGIAKTVIAFSNTAGGKLIIGVEDNLTIKGITTEEADIFPDKIANMLHDLCYPSILPEIYLQSIEDKIVLVVEIYPGNLRPYYLRSKGKEQGVYIRIGATNKQADIEMISELERQRLNISYDELEEIFYKVSDKDIENLKKSFFKYTGKILDKDKMLKDLFCYVIQAHTFLIQLYDVLGLKAMM